jgi:predicted transposase YbfD/YdcC
LRKRLWTQVRGLARSKSLRAEHLPCGVLAVDGKGIGTLQHDAGGRAQKAHRVHDGSPYWLSRVLRAALVSAPSCPCVDQMVVPPSTNEMRAFEDFFAGLVRAYGSIDLFEVVTADAGFCSKHNADLVAQANKAYVFAVKEPQPVLLAEARRLLEARTQMQPDAQTGWQKVKGKLVRRRLWRTAEIAGFHGWAHLRQAWLVEQQTRSAGRDSAVTTERRFFVTNLRSGRLSAQQALALVRAHWGIENDVFWTLDTQWREDGLAWCTQGRAVETLGFLRAMAYNLMQLARRRHLRERGRDGQWLPPSWRLLFGWTLRALLSHGAQPDTAPS